MEMDQEITENEAEAYLRAVLAKARAEAANLRTADPIMGRAWALVATHTEDALRVLLLPVP